MKGKSASTDHLYNKPTSEPKTNPSSVNSFPRPRTPSHRKSLDSTKVRAACPSSSKKTMNAASLRRNSYICENALSKGRSTPPPPPKKPRVQIPLPSWRPVDTSRYPNWRSIPGPCEDLSDEVIRILHLFYVIIKYI